MGGDRRLGPVVVAVLSAPAVISGQYGYPPPGLPSAGPGAVQFSPLVPGASELEEIAPGALAAMTMLAPPGTIERRYVLALSLKLLAEGGRLTVMAPKDKGGSRLRAELEAFGCEVAESSKKHHRICVALKPAAPAPAIEFALLEGGPQLTMPSGLWSQPGVFSWNRPDPGSELLIKSLPPLSGAVADFGCGNGYLAKEVLGWSAVSRLTLADIDRRAVRAARRNIDDPRADIRWADVRDLELEGLDFVVMNPPFHDGGAEDRALGQAFIRKARESLRTGGLLLMVANRHLPYERVLGEAFKAVTLKAETNLYKVYEARR